MRDIIEQIYDELNAQVIRMLEHARKQAERIAELERENSSLAYELNVALSGGSVSIPSADTDKLRETFEAAWPEIHKSGMDHGWRGIAWASWQSCAASTALQAPVREVPEVNDAKYSEAEKAIGKIIFQRYPRIQGHRCASITIGILEYMGLRHSALNYEPQEKEHE